MPKIYNNFSEIENEIRTKVPPVIYKYRDWNLPFNKITLSDHIAWFTHPKDLNDPYDIRVPVRFDFTEIETPIFRERLEANTAYQFPHVNPTSREFKVICDNKMDLILKDPQKHFEENYLEMRESDVYDPIGVFCVTIDPLNETMWAYYAKDSSGYCMGFDSLELARLFDIKFGFVEYNDTPPLHSFIRPMDKNQVDETFYKHSKWEHEAEVRLLTFAIKKDEDRAKEFPKTLVKEVIVGDKIKSTHLEEIKEILRAIYNSTVPLFQIAASASSYGLIKKAIPY